MLPRIARTALLFWILVLFSTPLAAQPATLDRQRSPVPKDVNARFLDPDLNPEEWLERFEIESREVYACRKAIVDALRLESGNRVADVGSGTGLFLTPFSRAVTDTGQVFAVDISPRLIEHMRQRVTQEKLTNVEVVLSDEESAQLPEESVDVVFICDTYHHFEYHAAMLRSIRSALRSGGQLVVIDFERIPGESREWILGHVRAGKDVFRHEVERSGFEFVEEVKIPGFQENYFLRFKKR